MLLASGVNYGFRRTIPHLLGVCLGCAAMLLLVGLGLSFVFAAAPVIQRTLRYVGAAYLLWLAWKIAAAGAMRGGAGASRPLTFWQAAAFQWVNPKAWMLVVGAIATYAPQDGFVRNVAVLAGLFILINAPSVGLWAVGGAMLRPFLSDPRRVRIFNLTMALLLVLSLLPMLRE